MESLYYTVEKQTTGIYKEKGSKFYSYLFPIINEIDVNPILSKLKKEHPQARHFCYAWKIGFEKGKHRINDDGEPSGTAGNPIFNQILSQKLSNVLIVVVRYFGGTLLGKSGLISAYKTSAKEAVKNAKKVLLEERIALRFDFDYHLLNEVMKILKKMKGEICKQTINQKVQIGFDTTKKEWEIYKEALSSLDIKINITV
ncbi:MAG: YigZ family protein [Flavobacteriia bacterium]|nr:YigZ family protein [Flavobacteriia bacterium]